MQLVALSSWSTSTPNSRPSLSSLPVRNHPQLGLYRSHVDAGIRLEELVEPDVEKCLPHIHGALVVAWEKTPERARNGRQTKVGRPQDLVQFTL